MSESEEGQLKPKATPLNYNMKYKLRTKIGQGTYGSVYLSVYNNKKYALKKICTVYENGLSMTTIREIKLLKKLKHKNLIDLVDIAYHGNEPYSRFKCEVYLVFPYMDYELYNFIRTKKLDLIKIKSITKQIAEGLKFLHDNNIIHRDMKSANILLDIDLNVKIADFGLISTADRKDKTLEVVTLWYRPPELILGDKHYTNAIDIWSFGTIIAEMFLQRTFLKADNEIDLLHKIINICGSINSNTYEGVNDLEQFKNLNLPNGNNRIVKLFDKYDKQAADLLSKMVVVDPKKRLTIDEILQHPFLV